MSDLTEPDDEFRNRDKSNDILAPQPKISEPVPARNGQSKPDEEIEPAEAINPHTIERRRRFDFEEEEGEPEKTVRLPFDPARLVDAFIRTWYLWITAGLITGSLMFCWYYSKPRTVATMQLIRRDVPMLFRASDAGEAFKPQQFSDQTLMTLVRSPELFQRVSARTNPRISPSVLARELYALPERDTELVSLYYKGTNTPRTAILLLNLFAEEIVKFTQEMQAREGEEVKKTLGEKLATVETNLALVQAEMQKIPPELKYTDPDRQTEAYLVQLSELDIKYEMARIEMEVSNPIAEKLQTAKDELASLLVRYTEAHPLVQDAQARVNALEKQLAASTNTAATGPNGKPNDAGSPRARLAVKQLEEIKALRQRIQDKLNNLSGKNLGYSLVKQRYQSLEMLRTLLLSRQREAELYAQNAVGYYKLYEPAGIDRASTKVDTRKLIMFAVAAGLFGMGLTVFLVLLVELADSKIRTTGDLERTTGLPVLATLGDASQLSDQAQEAWAFRTWTILKGKISQPHKSDRRQALVCGLISAGHGEGRSTWIKLLAKTAHQRGLRVLVAATRPSPEPPLHPHEPRDKKEPPMKISVAQSVVAFPFQAAQQLNDPKSHAIVHIPLPGWVWNLERRQQWQSALEEWMKIENLVFLVELPPASEPEAILLAENLPQVIWLADSGKVSMADTRAHLETLRQAGCNLVGTVLNHEPPSFFKRYFSRWIGTAAVFFALGTSLFAQQNGTPTESTNDLVQLFADDIPLVSSNASLSATVNKPVQRPEWQQHLTLGVGDVLNLSFYGDTNLTKYDVMIGMDGRITYLQAHDIVASGLTVDQLREKLNTELAKYYRTPRVIVAPVSYRSKRYYVMGRVVTKGAFVLDRPISIIEAVTRARGLETGIADRNSVDLADLQRSFLLRQGRRVPVDFQKLFEQGDFSQNLSLEPNDFLYFAPATLKEVYVLGEVRAPGVVPFTEGTTLMRMIAERGGFTESAFKHRVLVIRGSLNKPQTYMVNSWAILDAREKDFKLQARDIVYVSKRPFIKVEELLDIAITSFLQSATTEWAGVNIGPIISSPILPTL